MKSLIGYLRLIIRGIPGNFLFPRILICDCFLPLGFRLCGLRNVLLPKTKNSCSNRCERYRRQNPGEPTQLRGRLLLLSSSLLCVLELLFLPLFFVCVESFSKCSARIDKAAFLFRKVLASFVEPTLRFD